MKSNFFWQGNVDRVSTRQWAQDSKYDPEKIFNKLFYDDIKYLLSMSDLWKKRTPPTPMKYGEFDEDTTAVNTTQLDSLNLSGANRDQKVWTLRECQSVFATSLAELQKEFEKLAIDDNLVWDKDDKAAMDFVAACANVRAKIFNIPLKSRFEIKSMAGNIIPAIATTNAITAGLVVMRAFNVLLEQYEQCQSVYVRLRLNPRNQIFVPDRGMFYSFLSSFINQLSHVIHIFGFSCIHFVLDRIDGTKSKMHCMLGKTTGCGKNRYKSCYSETIPR